MADQIHNQQLEYYEVEQIPWQYMINATSDAIVVGNSSGLIIGWNNAAEALFGYSANEIKGRPIHMIMAERFRDLHQKGLQRVVNGGEKKVIGRSVEVVALHKNGNEFKVNLSLTEWKTSTGQYFGAIIREVLYDKQVEQIHKSQQRLSSMVENNPLAVIEWDADFKVVAWNKSAERIFGFGAEEAIGRHAAGMIVPAEYKEAVDQVWNALVAQKGGNRSTNPNVTKDGRNIMCDWFNTTLIGPDGETLGVASLVMDITEQEEAKREVDDLLKFSAEAIGIVNTRTGLFESVNEAAEQLYGLSRGDLVKVGPAQMSPEFQPDGRPSAEKAMEKIGEALQGGKPTFEWMHVNSKGENILCEIRLVGMAGDQNHKVRFSAHDISERKKAENTLQEAERNYRDLYENNPLMLFTLDTNGTTLAVNQAAVEQLGYSSTELVGQSVLKVFPPSEHSKVLKTFNKFVENHVQIAPWVFQKITKSGDLIWVSETVRLIHNEQGTPLVFISCENITERKKLEEESKTSFERRARQVQFINQISQQIATSTDLQDLYRTTVKLIKEELGYYHVQLLQHDPQSNKVVLIEGYGDIGQKMKNQNHSMAMGKGLIGTAAETGQTILRSNLQNDSEWQSNPLLPETKAEIAVPIKFRDQILGVLDVQGSSVNSISNDDILLLESLCGQIAVTMESTRLQQQLNLQLQELNVLQRTSSRTGWEATKNLKDYTAYVYERSSVAPYYQNDNTTDTTQPQVVSPMSVRGEVIGSIGVYEDLEKPLSLEERSLLESISIQVSQALESARLFEQTQKSAADLATVADVSTTTSSLLDPEELLQSVVDITKEKFDLYHAHVYLLNSDEQNLVLAKGAGVIGQKMVEDQWQIAYDHPNSIVAQAARTRKSQIENNIKRDANSPFLSNQLLPNTRSEMAVPMIVGEKVIGVFDVQSDIPNRFTQEDINIYNTLASQIAVAYQNAILYVQQSETVERLRELDRLKSSFLANMSHELRTPLNSIIGFTEVMLEGLDGPITPNMDNDLKLINKNGQHLLHLINDVLDMAKIESGKMNLLIEKFDIHEIFEEVINITSPQASEKVLSFTIDPTSQPDLQIHADRTRIRQVMLNIVNNALKFTEKGNITIRAVKEDKDNILISVKDTGIGIPADYLEPIFYEFTQVDTSTTRKTGGTGLGLPISRKLIELHGGKIWAESTGIAGEGSTFFLRMPIENTKMISEQVVRKPS